MTAMAKSVKPIAETKKREYLCSHKYRGYLDLTAGRKGM